MKTLKYFMALVIALCTTFTFTSCDEDDVTSAVTFSDYTLSVSASSGDEVTNALVAAFAPQLSSYQKEFTNVNELAAKAAFKIVADSFDSKFQAKADEYNCTVTVALRNTKTGEVVSGCTRTYAPTAKTSAE